MELEDLERSSGTASPPIMIAEDGGESDYNPGSPRTTAAANDWQIVEDGLLSQCGSTPRSLSHQDLDSGEPSSASDSEVTQEDVSTKGEGEQDEDEIKAHEDHTEAALVDAPQMQPHDTQESLPVSVIQATETVDDTIDQDSEESMGDAMGVEDLLEGDGAQTDECPDAYLSGHSSFADVSMADGQQPVNQELVDSLSASVISEMIAAAEEADSEVDIVSESEEQAVIPDSGVFSIATGYPLDSLLLPNQASRLDEPSVTLPRLFELPADLGYPSDSASSVSASTAGERSPQLEEPSYATEPSKWRNWLHAPGSSRAAKVLHRIWFQLQVIARRAGACIPFALRRRVAALLRSMDHQTPQGGKGSLYLAYGAAFVGFVLALRYYRECHRLRQLNIAQKDAFDLHVLKVLDLNEKLGRGMSIPITQNCGLKDLSFSRRSYGPMNMGLSSHFLATVP